MGFAGNTCWDMVFMEGYLKKSGKRRAKRRYFVLHQPSTEWDTRLDCYDNQSSWEKRNSPRYTVYLSDLFKVTSCPNKRFPHSFGLYTKEKKIHVCAESEQTMKAWIDVINFNKKEEEQHDVRAHLTRSWNVHLRNTGCHLQQDSDVLVVTISMGKVEFTRNKKFVLSIFLRYVLKYGFTENYSYLELSEGGYEKTGDKHDVININNVLRNIANGNVLLWAEFDSAMEAEGFCSEICAYKKSIRKRSNTETNLTKYRSTNYFKRSLSYSDMLDVPNENEEKSFNAYVTDRRIPSSVSVSTKRLLSEDESTDYCGFVFPINTVNNEEEKGYGPVFLENSNLNTKVECTDTLQWTTMESVKLGSVVEGTEMNTTDESIEMSTAMETESIFASGEYQSLTFSVSDDEAFEDESRDKLNVICRSSKTSYSGYSIKDHLLSRSATKSGGARGLQKSSTSSSFADDESEVGDDRSGNDLSNRTSDTVFNYLNVKVHDNETDSNKSLPRDHRKISKEEESKKRKKLNRDWKNSREVVKASNFRAKKNSEDTEYVTTSVKTMETMDMGPVSLIGFKTPTHHFQEPHYEAIRDYTRKIGSRGGFHSNSSSPESSPKLFQQKYVLRPKTPSPKSSLKMLHPPLPRRNRSTPNLDQIDGHHNDNNNYADVTFDKNGFIKSKQHDVDVKNNKKNNKKAFVFKSKVDHPYAEIKPVKPKRTSNSSDGETPPAIRSPPLPDRSPPLGVFRRNPLFIDCSKSDGELSDSDVLDVPRYFNRRRSKTGVNDLPELPTGRCEKPRNRMKQNYRFSSSDKNVYVSTVIQPRRSNGSNSSLKEIVRHIYTDNDEEHVTYENNFFPATNGYTTRGSSSGDDDSECAGYENEPPYENPDSHITTRTGDIPGQQPTYENSALYGAEKPLPEYAAVPPNSLSLSSSNDRLDSALSSSYNNITFNRKNNELEYADIEINTPHYDNVSSSPDESATDDVIKPLYKYDTYAEIDFNKTDGLKEALNQLRCTDDTNNPELNTNYKIDLSHIKFTRISTENKRKLSP